jgi:hypothetical protein
MIKDEALKMAIKTIESMCEKFMPKSDWRGVAIHDDVMDVLIKCHEALMNSSWQKLDMQEIGELSELAETTLLIDGLPDTEYVFEFARAIEQALKEKNYGTT